MEGLMKKILILPILLFITSCGVFSSSTTTTTTITTTTISYGSDCNSQSYVDFSNKLIEIFNGMNALTKNLFKSNNYSKYIDYLLDLRFLVEFLDVKNIDKYSLLQAIDAHMEDVGFYIAYDGNDYSTSQVINSSNVMSQNVRSFHQKYSTLCGKK